MSSSKISPILPLAIGVICIGAAVVGLAISMTRVGDEEMSEKPLGGTPIAVQTTSLPRPVAEPEPVEIEEEEVSEEELRRELVRILLGRIAQTDREFNDAWLQKSHRFIKTPEDLQAFWDDYLALGQMRSQLMERAQVRSKKRMPHDPRYFVSQATATLTQKDNTETALLKGVKENMALALYKKKEEEEAVEHIDPEFMGNFYKKILLMYNQLDKMAAEEGRDASSLMDDRIRTLEATIYDRYMYVVNKKNVTRSKKEGTGHSAASDLFRTDRMDMVINSYMLELGQIYHKGAVDEVIDRKKHQFYADQAFRILAMVYQRTHSGEALNLMREVNDIQRDYLHRLAKVNWKRAQLAAAAGETDKADNGYYVATQRYLQSMGQSVEGRRKLLAREFVVLKEEIARWQHQKRSLAAVDGG